MTQQKDLSLQTCATFLFTELTLLRCASWCYWTT